MVKRLEKKPFEQASDDILWLGLYYKKELYCYFGIELLKHFVSAHAEVVKWNHNIAKMFKIDWEEIKFICKSLGANEIIASNDNLNDKRWPKFIKMFGFSEPKLILVSRQEI